MLSKAGIALDWLRTFIYFSLPHKISCIKAPKLRLKKLFTYHSRKPKNKYIRLTLMKNILSKWMDQMELGILMLWFSNTRNRIIYYYTVIPCDKHHSISLNKQLEFYPVWTRWGRRWTSTNLLAQSSLDNHLDSLKKANKKSKMKS